MADHPNKHIREAVKYALAKGWRLKPGGAHSHVWGILLCPHRGRDGHRVNVHSTPSNPQQHARLIRTKVDTCHHTSGDEGDQDENI